MSSDYGLLSTQSVDGRSTQGSQGRQERSASVQTLRTSRATSEDVPRQINKELFADNRDLLRSLDDMAREDLSKHLLLNFHLNRYYNDVIQKRGSLERPKDGYIVIDEEEEDEDAEDRLSKASRSTNEKALGALIPSRRRGWRGWPLDLSQVPRLEQDTGITESLKSCLLAATLRHATAQMRSREDADAHVFSADDDVSSKVCGSSINKVVTMLDQLLASMYRSREGYAANQSLQNLEALYRNRRTRSDPEDIPREATTLDESSPHKRRKLEAGFVPSGEQNGQAANSKPRSKRQASQKLNSETEVMQHALVQSFPLPVLQRTARRLDVILKSSRANMLDRNQYILLAERKEDYAGLLRLTGDRHGANIAPLGSSVQEIHNGMERSGSSPDSWATLSGSHMFSKRLAADDCFRNDGFLEEIPGQGWSNERRRRNYQNRRRQEKETHNG